LASTTSHTIALDRNRRYLVTGALAGKSGDYGQVFIATVCTMPSNDLRRPSGDAST
jgi:hypothetical protein